jgi:guanylate kinase
VEEAIAAGKTMLLEIDVQGARSIREAIPSAVLIFIEPPSWEVLEARLRARKTESDEAIARRLANAKAEMAAAPGFDHRIVNDDLEDAVQALVGIIEGTRPGPSAGNPSEETP